MAKKDLIEVNIGDRYNSLVIIKEVEKINNRRAFLCKCDCGNEVIKQLIYLRNGDTKSCGCRKTWKRNITKSRKGQGLKTNRIGEEIITKSGYKIKIIEYRNRQDITVEFDDGTQVKSGYNYFEDGVIKHPCEKSVRGIGFKGITNSQVEHDIRARKIWSSIITRCYVKSNKYKSYHNCTIADEWLNFQNFLKWYSNNYYELPGETVSIDKDLLSENCKIYSKDTCIFIPMWLNMSIINSCDKERFYNRKPDKYGKYSIYVSYKNKKYFVGYFKLLTEAYNAYKYKKRALILKDFKPYKNLIPDNIYNKILHGIEEFFKK